MIPVKIDTTDYDYPEFQPDQILTSEDLNHVFDFLFLQERLTRTNLIGIGIVCGLTATKSTDGKTITITKGTGVTSHGYLMTHGIENSEEAIDYKKYRPFDALKDERYPVFVTGNTPRYTLWELVPFADEKPTDTELSNGFLDDKVVLLFYEMLTENAKNCDPVSCDDKGVKVYINIRKLLVSKTQADLIILECNTKANASGSGDVFPDIHNLPEIRMARFDVAATPLKTASDVYAAYQKIFSEGFVQLVAKALNDAFQAFKTYLHTNANPFSNFKTNLKFLYDGTIAGNSLLHFQYYYDLFTDLLQAYHEWRKAGYCLIGMCTPPEALFPRHLFLGELSGLGPVKKSKYRNYFISAPVHGCKDAHKQFLALFQRLERMLANFSIPLPVFDGTTYDDKNIRITPSRLGKDPLGERAIPYYYKPNQFNNKLLDVWNYELTAKGKQKQVLHYEPDYATDPFVKFPLQYDLEPYNFLRVEGHIGKRFYTALATIQGLRDKNRLPFQVVAVSVDSLPESVDPARHPCYFQDLAALYETLLAEWRCKLCKALACLYRLPQRTDGEDVGNLTKSTLELVKGCKEVLGFNDKTVGAVYEKLHPAMVKTKAAGVDLLQMLTDANLFKKMEIEAAKAAAEGEGEREAVVFFSQLIRNLSLLGEILTDTLSDFDFALMNTAVKRISGSLRLNTNSVVRDRLTTTACLKDLLDLCDLAAFRALAAEYKERIDKVKLMATLGQFAKQHPGLQHKGGVPVGGTFVIVYRDLESDISVAPVQDFEMGDLILAKAEATVVAAATQPKAKAAKVKYTPKELLTHQKNITLLRKKGMADAEIEAVLNVIIVDIFQPKGLFDDKLANIENGTVIADFFLPYICSSDCSPINFVINIPPPKVELALTPMEYCQADEGTYRFTTNPAGGELTSTGQDDSIKKISDGVFDFLPNKVKIPAGQKDVSVSFTYKVGDQSQTITIKVYRKPPADLKFEISPIAARTYNFGFKEPDLLTSAEWNFGDDTPTVIAIAPQHTYQKGGTYVVTATARNGLCATVAEPITVQVAEAKPVEVKLEEKEVCIQTKEVKFTITPPGGTLSGEGANEEPKGSGSYTFIPPTVALNGLSQRTITFNYVSPENQTATFSIKVFEKPKGQNSFVRNGMKVNLILQNMVYAQIARVDYGDGTTVDYPVTGTAFTAPAHSYTKKEQFTLTVMLVNGACTTRLPELTVDLSGDGQVQKVCLDCLTPMELYSTLDLQTEAFGPLYKTAGPEVNRFFAALNKALDNNGYTDPAFFDKNPMKATWIEPLAQTPAEVRTTSINLMIIFVRLLMAWSCSKKEDLDENAASLFNAIIEKLALYKKLPAAEKKLLTALAEEVKAEYKNISSNAEAGIKKKYLSMLATLLTRLEELINA